MIEHFKRLSNRTLIYGLGDAVVKRVAFFFIPLYTKILTEKAGRDYFIIRACFKVM